MNIFFNSSELVEHLKLIVEPHVYLIHLQKDEVYLNLMLEYIPETVYKVARQYAKSKQTIPINFIRVGVFFFLFFIFILP